MLTAFLGRQGSVKSKPSLLLTGPSGAGKTDSIGKLALGRHDDEVNIPGLRVLHVDVEKRGTNIQKCGVLAVHVSELDDLRKFLVDVMPDGERRREFVKEYSKGVMEDVDVIGIDSLMEVLAMLDGDLGREFPSKTEGKSYERWGQYGSRGVGFVKACRDLSCGNLGEAVGVIVTLGLQKKVSPVGEIYYEDFVKGNIVGPHLPFCFDYVFRLVANFDGENVHHLLYTAGDGLKGPGTDILPPVCDVTGFGMCTVWDRLVKHSTGD